MMKAIDRLYTKDEKLQRSIHIDQNLYSKLQSLAENVFDASVSQIINVCIEHTLLKHKDIPYYKKPDNVDSIYRSIVLRKTFFDSLSLQKDKTGISFSRLLNSCINEFLNDYNL